jgi:hypothetical protein
MRRAGLPIQAAVAVGTWYIYTVLRTLGERSEAVTSQTLKERLQRQANVIRNN